MKTGQAIVIGLIIGVLGGIGFVHLTIAGDVSSQGTRLNRVEKDLESERDRNDQRIFEMAGLCKEIIASNREQMQIMRTQNELLRQYLPNK